MERIVQFQRLLEETMVWCASQNWDVNPATGLRTALLRPSEQASVEQTFSDYGKFWKKTVQQRQQVVEQLAIKRAELLQDQNVKSLHSKQALTGGRLLAFDPLETTSDGGAWQATQGFFDYNSVPAWDTWVYYDTGTTVPGALWHRFDSYLLSWIPEPLVEVVADGIDCDIGKCIVWATDLDTAFMRQLREAGLLR